MELRGSGTREAWPSTMGSELAALVFRTSRPNGPNARRESETKTFRLEIRGSKHETRDTHPFSVLPNPSLRPFLYVTSSSVWKRCAVVYWERERSFEITIRIPPLSQKKKKRGEDRSRSSAIRSRRRSRSSCIHHRVLPSFGFVWCAFT